MKNKFRNILILLIIITTTSCNNSNDEIIDVKNEVISFDTKISSNQKNAEVVTFVNIKTTQDDYNELIIGLELTVDMKNLKAYAAVQGTDFHMEFDLVLNENKLYDLVEIYDSQQKQSYWCAIRCGIEAAIIASADGPAPFMDMAAIGYAIECGSNC